jgi:hypothetical protein
VRALENQRSRPALDFKRKKSSRRGVQDDNAWPSIDKERIEIVKTLTPHATNRWGAEITDTPVGDQIPRLPERQVLQLLPQRASRREESLEGYQDSVSDGGKKQRWRQRKTLRRVGVSIKKRTMY